MQYKLHIKLRLTMTAIEKFNTTVQSVWYSYDDNGNDHNYFYNNLYGYKSFEKN